MRIKNYTQDIDFQKNNFSLSAPLPQIPYLKWARVRLNSDRGKSFSEKNFCLDQILATENIWHDHLVNLFFGNVYRNKLDFLRNKNYRSETRYCVSR
jgi:hypothetical protein